VRGALEHVTVLEFGGYAAGPVIGKYLANFGARVVHVESRERPDGFRQEYPPFKGGRSVDHNGCFAYFNDSKHDVTINLKTEAGIAVAHRLVDISDVVIENMRPGVMEKLGLGVATLRARKPSLIYLSTCNMGHTGPFATHPGFGSQLSSFGGFTELIGRSDGPPNFVYGPFIDLVAVAYGGVAVLAALDRRQRTGEGAHIDISQYENGVLYISPALLDYAANGAIAHRAGNSDPVAAPHGCYPCRDGRWCALSCWDDDEWHRFCGAADHLDWAFDPRFAHAAARRANQAELDRLISGWTQDKDVHAVRDRLQLFEVHAGVVNTMKDLFDDPQVSARGVWQTHAHPAIGRQRYRMVSYQLSETPGRVSGAAPTLGQSNAEVFRGWLDMSQAEYDALDQQGAFS
jgi:crotonobetainyl-CoA:carnitine CoA-transferase CaiB-like acyl-CoA transferase